MPNPRFEFWFEYGSTYSYLSVMRIENVARCNGIAVTWRPFLLMPILKDFGLPDGPFANPVKRDYMWRDLERRAKAHKLAYRKPSVYPPNTLVTARIGTLAADEEWCAEFSRNVFQRHWVDDVIIGSDENLRASIAACGHDPDQVLERAQAQKNKDRLRERTEQARAAGIFGSPSFLAGEELFWGDDRLEDALGRVRIQ